MRWDHIPGSFECNVPASKSEIVKFETNARFKLPIDYAEFLTWANGGEGSIGDKAYVVLWKLEELIEMNNGYNVAESAPGLFLFGSNGGGEAFAFDGRTSAMSVVCVPFILELEAVINIAPTFTDFIDILYREGFPHAAFRAHANS